jgi:hypothetical protein
MTELQIYSQKQLITLGTLLLSDVEQVMLCRRDHNKLGFAYQLIFVKLHNFFPIQTPFEIVNEILVFASVQIGIEQSIITNYTKRQPTISEHQNQIREYLRLSIFNGEIQGQLEKFIFNDV